MVSDCTKGRQGLSAAVLGARRVVCFPAVRRRSGLVWGFVLHRPVVDVQAEAFLSTREQDCSVPGSSRALC